MSDIEIARAAKKTPIQAIGTKLGLPCSPAARTICFGDAGAIDGLSEERRR